MKKLLIALAFLVSTLTDAGAQECTLKKLASVPITLSASGLPIIPVSVNGTERQFGLATGNAFTEIKKSLVSELGLPTSRTFKNMNVKVYSGGGNVSDRFAKASTIAVGQVGSKDWTFLIKEGPNGVDGVLGADFLMNFDVELDFGPNLLNFFTHDHCAGNAVYWTTDYVALPFRVSKDSRIVVPVTLDGKDFDVAIGTEDSVTTLSLAHATSLFGLRENSPDMERISESQSISYRRRFASLSFGGLEVKNPLIYLAVNTSARDLYKDLPLGDKLDPTFGFDFDMQEMGVGMNILSKLHLFIAYKEKVLYVSAAGAH